MRTSYSALETYKLCPQKYKFEVLDRIPAKKSKPALFGTHVHATLRYLFSPTPLFPTLDEVLTYFRDNFPPPEIMAVTPEEKQIYLADGERMLKAFYAKNPPWSSSVVDLETRFEVLLEDPKHGKTHVLAGRVDRIDKVGDDGYEIIDYKTSRRMPSQADVDSNLQLSIYALGLQKRWPHVKAENMTLSLYFLKHGEKLSSRRTPEAMRATAQDVLKTVSEIESKLAAGERFEPIPGPWCDFCSYKPVCPAWRHLYRNRETGIKSQEEIDAALAEYFAIVKSAREATARLGELKAKIREYMEREGFDRVFGGDGYLTRSVQKRFAYDFERVRGVLEPLGKWAEVLSADEKKLAAVMKELAPEVRSAIEDAKVLVREFTVLSASTKKIKPPLAASG